MKINVTITIDMPEPQDWVLAYGCESSAAAIREDVKNYVGNLVQQSSVFDGEVAAEINWK